MLRTASEIKPENLFPLRPPLPLPQGVTEEELFQWLLSIRVSGSSKAEMESYCRTDFRRFVYTWGLMDRIKKGGNVLELGANPYFTTFLIKQFSRVELTLANYFGPQHPTGAQNQTVAATDFVSRQPTEVGCKYFHFNIEQDRFPFDDKTFECVLFCEIIEHLLNDPCKVLREIKRILKPKGFLILTTPNVARLENVARLIAGANIYDPYSGYGPYGRHNREYNRHEIVEILKYEGFEPEVHFTADVHANNSAGYSDLNQFSDLVKFRENDLGQYLFVRAKNTGALATKRPSWLYRSMPAGQLD